MSLPISTTSLFNITLYLPNLAIHKYTMNLTRMMTFHIHIQFIMNNQLQIETSQISFTLHLTLLIPFLTVVIITPYLWTHYRLHSLTPTTPPTTHLPSPILLSFLSRHSLSSNSWDPPGIHSVGTSLQSVSASLRAVDFGSITSSHLRAQESTRSGQWRSEESERWLLCSNHSICG